MKKILKRIYDFCRGGFMLLVFFFNERKKIIKADIIYFFPYYHTGGAERVHINILKSMQHKNCTVIFTHGSATKSRYEEFKAHSKLIELNPILNKKNKWLSAKLRQMLIVFINSSSKVKIVFSSNTLYFYEIIPELKQTIKKIDLFHAFEKDDVRESYIISSAALIHKRIVINEKGKSELLKFYRNNSVDYVQEKKINIIHNGVEFVDNPSSHYNDTPLKIGYIGRWSPEKRPELFLNVATKLNASCDSLQFFMAGSGMRSNIGAIKAAQVSFLGDLTASELQALYQSLNFIVISSIYEGFPMVLMESMYYGVIPVVTNVGGISEHICHLENGILINDTTVDSIVNEMCSFIMHLLVNKSELERISRNARNYALENFSIDRFNVSYQELLN